MTLRLRAFGQDFEIPGFHVRNVNGVLEVHYGPEISHLEVRRLEFTEEGDVREW